MTTNIIPTESGTYTATITNSCICATYNEEAGEWETAPECWGDCWNEQVEDFENITQHLFTNDNQPFRIEGFPVWYGTIDGTFHARTAEKLLESITPDRTEWRLEVTVHATHLTGVLSHHDGTGVITVTPFSEDDE
jgi:hypothetical protein